MRRGAPVAIVTLGFVLIATFLIWRIGTNSPRGTSTVPAGSRVSPTESSPPPSCRERDGLPDPRCTPGAAANDVTQASIEKTICISGYTSKGIRSDGRPVRPPASFTDRLKTIGIVAYGYADISAADYEEDHLIPLELGGDGWSPANLWPEPRYGSHTAADKDTVENDLHRLVCSGRVDLVAAQRAIAANWETALKSV